MKMKAVLMIIVGLMLAFSTMALAKENADKILSETKELYKQAVKLQGAWVTTDKLIKNAQKAIKEGDQVTALKLAKKAKVEALLSIEQAEHQAKHWAEPAYIRR